MRKERFELAGIPAILWGDPSDRLYISVHGRMSSKESAETLAGIVGNKGYQTLSFDLPEHGERTGLAERCDVWTGIRDLNRVAEYAFRRWDRLSLFACSLGAYFSLQAYAEKPFEKALFLSPVVDMAFLVRRMMQWSGVKPEELEKKGTIDTPVEPLRWDYYQYIMAHPTEKWPVPTAVLYGGRDEMQSPEVMRSFARRFHADLTVSPESEHPFMAETDQEIVEKWMTVNG